MAWSGVTQSSTHYMQRFDVILHFYVLTLEIEKIDESLENT